ncbi:MAG TPA: SDR family NAD(P)-dependent oxidoreductase [Polyangiaceae bacterium]|nr:SDR family NAD(P)-dependent oxidoreductase [Polyangiaceae bacterium]
MSSPSRSMNNALVTGASSGLGRALATRLGRDGWRVVLAARRQAALDEVAATIRAAGGEAVVGVLDVADTTRCVAAIRGWDDELGGLDLVIANAGVGPELSASPLSWEALAGPCHVNYCGAVATLTAVLPRMVERGRGHLVGISSLSSFGALPESAAYCSPKAGLNMMLDCLRLDGEPHGVAVTTVHAGFIDTPMVAHRREAMPQLVPVDEAAARIVDALPSRPARIDFPQPLAWVARAGARLPRPLRDRLVRRAVKAQ